MALSPAIIYNSLVANRAAGGFAFNGQLFDKFALGIANAVSVWAVGQPDNVALRGKAAGFVGTGTIASPASKIIIPPHIPLMLGALAGAGVRGQLAPSLAVVMTLGISQAFVQSGQYGGIVLGVGVGADSSKIVLANVVTLVPLLSANLAGTLGGTGVTLPNMSWGLGLGICALLSQGVGVGAVVGVPVFPPATGTGTSTSVVL